MKYAIAIYLLLSVCYRPATAQKAYTILESHKELDPSRYDEIKGSPYLYSKLKCQSAHLQPLSR